MVNYYIEYKSMDFPYSYKYDRQTYKTVTGVRKKCMALIDSHKAIVCVIRWAGGWENLVYITMDGKYVLEDRGNDKWYHLNKDGSLGTQIRNKKKLDIVQSARQRW